MTDGLPMYVVYHDPSDYPGKWVLRRHQVSANGSVPDLRPMAVTDDLESCRASVVARGLHNLGRMEGDEPQIYEVWI